MELLLALTLCLVAGLLMYVVDRAFTGRRTRQLYEEAQKLGFSLRSRGDPLANTDTHGLAILERDPSAIIINLMEGVVGPYHAAIFDVGHFNPCSPLMLYTTVAAFRCPSGCLPVFELQLHTALERLEEVLHLGTSEHQFCQDGLLLKFDEASKALNFLAPQKTSKLRGHRESFQVETSHDWLFFYIPGARVRPRALKQFVDLASEIATTLLEGPGKLAAAPA